MKLLLTLRNEKGYPRDPRALLDLAALPAMRLRRPRSMSELHASAALIQLMLFDRGTVAGSRTSKLDPVAAAR